MLKCQKYFHLHSTMYLLNPDLSSKINVSTEFTFHYVPIKSQSLYTLQMRDIHLHSTMYLLNPIDDLTNCPQNLIYIPLCTY